MSEAQELAPGVAYLPIYGFINVYFVGEPGGEWVLVDTGIENAFEAIRAAAVARFGERAPTAIYLTHGHQDHVGSALALATYWNVPVYVHGQEMPYVTGQSDYPPADPSVGGLVGFVARFAGKSGTDLGEWVQVLPEEGLLPGLEGWKAVEAPGHAPGQVAYFREEDGFLIAGDALTTVDIEKFSGKEGFYRPPLPFTCDWQAVRRTWNRLGGLKPKAVACGHGKPRVGSEVAEEFQKFVDLSRVPDHGRYVVEPARTDENGIVELPPAVPDTLPRKLAMGAVVLAGTVLGFWWVAKQARAHDKE